MLDAPLVSAKAFKIRKSHGCPLQLGNSARERPEAKNEQLRKQLLATVEENRFV